MKRLHVHLSVANLEHNIDFYSTMFSCKPTVQHDDYAKWMLDDPRGNFAISNRSEKPGLDHLGIQADDEDELQAIKQQLDATQAPLNLRKEPSVVTPSQINIGWQTLKALLGNLFIHSMKSRLLTIKNRHPMVRTLMLVVPL